MLANISAVILIGMYIGIVVYLRKRRAWLTYYLFAAFGLVLLLVMGLIQSGLDKFIETYQLRIVTLLTSYINIDVTKISADTIRLQDSAGWVALMMGIESSALIECSTLIGLVSYYPTFTWTQKVRYLILGLIATIAINIMRIVIIVYIVQSYGRSSIFMAHAVIGRLFFFAFIIVLFWYMLTRPTIERVSKIIRGVTVE